MNVARANIMKQLRLHQVFCIDVLLMLEIYTLFNLYYLKRFFIIEIGTYSTMCLRPD